MRAAASHGGQAYESGRTPPHTLGDVVPSSLGREANLLDYQRHLLFQRQLVHHIGSQTVANRLAWCRMEYRRLTAQIHFDDFASCV